MSASGRLAPMDLARYRARVLDSYALVAYLPKPLGSFMDRLSRRLVPECKPRAHITLLPPRHLRGSLEEAKATLEAVTRNLSAFELEITCIELFDITSVIYANIGLGRTRLMEIHRSLNVDALHFTEHFAFHPHITLAVNPNPERLPQLVEEARAEWEAYSGSRCFEVNELHFVHNVALETWENVARYPLTRIAAATLR